MEPVQRKGGPGPQGTVSNMLSARLVLMIEDHADELLRGLMDDLQTHPCTPSYHSMNRNHLRAKLHDLYRHLGRWLSDATDDRIEMVYGELGRHRHAEGIPLSELVFVLILAKYHLREFLRTRGLVDSAVELYQEQELQRLLGRFFDRAIYQTIRGYEQVLTAPGQAAA